MTRLAIFVSGGGTNMENLVTRARAGEFPAEPTLVVCDRIDAPAVKKCKRLNIEVVVVEKKNYPDKAGFENEILAKLERKEIDFLALAGFMKILSPGFVRKYWGRIVNIHPSLLPMFPGARAIRDAFEAKVMETGVTVHFVDPGIDTGPVILQRKVAVDPSDTLETLEQKIHAVEYEIYPEGLRAVLTGKVKAPAMK